MEKAPLLPGSVEPARPRPPRSHFSRLTALAFAFVLGLFWLSQTWDCKHDHRDHARTRVPLEVHIMSKCPDARDCIEQLVVPAMANVSDKVDFRLSFIGKTTEEDGGVLCKHGETECLGNIIELCAASEYPNPKIHLGFTMCLSHEYQQIPKRDLIEKCALEYGMDFEKLNDCSSRDDGAYGMNMLRDSVTRSAKLGIRTSCTVRLNKKTRCIRDDGRWKDCGEGSDPEDLISDIEKLYKKSQG